MYVMQGQRLTIIALSIEELIHQMTYIDYRRVALCILDICNSMCETLIMYLSYHKYGLMFFECGLPTQLLLLTSVHLKAVAI